MSSNNGYSKAILRLTNGIRVKRFINIGQEGLGVLPYHQTAVTPDFSGYTPSLFTSLIEQVLRLGVVAFSFNVLIMEKFARNIGIVERYQRLSKYVPYDFLSGAYLAFYELAPIITFFVIVLASQLISPRGNFLKEGAKSVQVKLMGLLMLALAVIFLGHAYADSLIAEQAFFGLNKAAIKLKYDVYFVIPLMLFFSALAIFFGRVILRQDSKVTMFVAGGLILLSLLMAIPLIKLSVEWFLVEYARIR